MDIGEFFNENYKFYDQDLLVYDHDFVKFIQENKNTNSTLLDGGGGMEISQNWLGIIFLICM